MTKWHKLPMAAGFLFFSSLFASCKASEDGEKNSAEFRSKETMVADKNTSERPIRVIVTLANHQDIEDARAALLRAGAILAESIEGQPMIVVEALQSQLNTALQNIEVKSIQKDSLSPSN